MPGRRDFLKSSLAAVTAATVLRPWKAFAAKGSFLAGIIYTADREGKWAGKAGSHAPKVSVEGAKVTITTAHPMSEVHFIVRHTLVAPDGTVLGAATFKPADEKAVSSYDLPAGISGTLSATSFCNLHDFWLTEFTV